jgi:hypothetical protein
MVRCSFAAFEVASKSFRASAKVAGFVFQLQTNIARMPRL